MFFSAVVQMTSTARWLRRQMTTCQTSQTLILISSFRNWSVWVNLRKTVLPGVTRCHQVSPGVTRCHQVSPGVTRCHQVSPGVTRCHQVSSGVIKCHWVSSDAIRCHQVSSDVIRCHQVSSDVIRCLQTFMQDHFLPIQILSGRPMCVN